MNTGFVELNRRFSPLSREIEFGEDYEDRIIFGLSQPVTWKDLISEYRVVILAEAGAGKTEEIRHMAISLRCNGRPAFFIRLEYLHEGIINAFEEPTTGTFEQFETWKATDEDAWIFLDSVDEARLESPMNFERAIRELGRALGDAGQRAHIYITSRVTEWRPTNDLVLIDQKLPFRAQARPQASADDGKPGLKVAPTNANVDPSEGDAGTAKVYSLARLTDDQIRIYAAGRGLIDGANFVAEIKRKDAYFFASRPRDLEDLISFWKAQGRIGSLLELIQASIDSKLKESDPNRAQMRSLSVEKATEGATRLAAGATFQKHQRIAIPDSSPNPNGIVASDILTGWTELDCSTLLARPLFDEAIYGTVRFHHRSVRECLTADWLLRILANGNSRRQIEQLFFTEQYGMTVLVPTTRPILPWMALFDERIRERAFHIAPEALFEGGDPSKFPLEFRARVIAAICEKEEAQRGRDYSFDLAAVQRFATPDLEPAVKALLVRYSDNDEIQSLLLRMVWQGRLVGCLIEAYRIAVDTNRGVYTRIAAIRAIGAIGTAKEVQTIAADVLHSAAVTDHRVIGELIDSSVPRLVSVEQVLSVIRDIEPPERFGHPSFRASLDEFVQANTAEENFAFIKGVVELLRQPPFQRERHYPISRRHSWLTGYVGKAAQRLVEERNPFALEQPVLFALSLYCLASRYDNDHSGDARLREIVPAWFELNRVLFWHDVAEVRAEFAKENKRLVQWWQARIMRDFWAFHPDEFDFALGEITARPLLDDKLVALSLAFSLYAENGRPKAWLKSLKCSTNENTELAESLATLLHPRPDPNRSRWKQQEKVYARRQKKRKAKEAERRTNWATWLREHTEVIRDVTVAQKATVWTAQQYLADRMRETGKDRNRWSHSNWRDLQKDHGQDVAEAFRDGAMAYWRQYTPPLRSEGIDKPNSVPYAVVFGLSGLEIESRELNAWTSHLSEEEAEKAVRYALWEMNGLPDWMPDLFQSFRRVALSVIVREIEWEMAQPKPDEASSYVLSDIVWHGEWATAELAPSVLERLATIDVINADALRDCLRIVFRSQITSAGLAEVASRRVDSAPTLELRAIWFAVWVATAPRRGFDAFAQAVSEIADHADALNFSMQFAVTLLGDRSHGVDARPDFKTVDVLKDIYLLLHRYIKIESDLERAGTGVYSPTIRDKAQEVRERIFALMQEVPGKEAFIALNEISEWHPDVNSRRWISKNLVRRAEQDSDLSAWSSADMVSFAETAERQPTSNRTLFALSVLRLLDLKDEIEEGDDSIAGILLREDQEPQFRIYIAKWLRDHARARYSTAQEEEFADAKRSDVRVHGMGFDGPVPIEIKIADKWPGSVLFERLRNQLCNDYLRDTHSQCGIFLMLHRGVQKRWKHPHSAQSLDFSSLILALQSEADTFIADRQDIEAITVIGIDLTKRATAKR